MLKLYITHSLHFSCPNSGHFCNFRIHFLCYTEEYSKIKEFRITCTDFHKDTCQESLYRIIEKISCIRERSSQHAEVTWRQLPLMVKLLTANGLTTSQQTDASCLSFLC